MSPLPPVDGIDVADLCITSSATVRVDAIPDGAFTMPEVPEVGVMVSLVEGDKCERCWKIDQRVGSYKHPGVCQRCDEVLSNDYSGVAA